LANGGQGAGQIGGLTLPVTNIIEKHVIFGGSSRLREQIKNTVHVLEGKLYLVISGCAPDLVGDDSEAMTKEIKDQGYPATYLQAPGFLGNAYQGYQMVVKTIIDFVAEQTEKPPGKIKGLVNIFGIVPGQDSFWQGDLYRLSQDLSAIGLIPNPLFGLDQTIDNWQQIPRAELNLVLSPWGLEIAGYLAERFGTPYLSQVYLPIGVEETKKLFQEIAKKINWSEELIRKSWEEAEGVANHFLAQFADAYFNFNFQTDFSIVGPVSQAIGVSRFLSATIGLIPKTIIITDNPLLKGGLSEEILLLGEKTRVFFAEDSEEIASLLRKEKTGLILGSILEKSVADEIGAVHLSLSFPVSDRIILNRGYAGYAGGLNLIEDIGSALIRKMEQI
jgi:nitrogenase molybdenum-iron protein beta chain